MPYLVRIVQRTRSEFTLQELWDIIFYPFATPPRFALWIHGTTSNGALEDRLFTLQFTLAGHDLRFVELPFTDDQRASIVKYAILLETTSNVDHVIAECKREVLSYEGTRTPLTVGSGNRQIRKWSYLCFIENVWKFGKNLREALPTLERKYGQWYQICNPGDIKREQGQPMIPYKLPADIASK